MKRDNYKCLSCNCIQEHWVADTDIFPGHIKCSKCSHIMRRVFSPKPAHIRQGKTGNYKNGYTSNEGYIKKT